MVTVVTALEAKSSGLSSGRERDHRGLLASSQARAIAAERASGVKSAPNQACRSIRCGVPREIKPQPKASLLKSRERAY